MHAFWLVLTYELLEDRRIDDVIIKTFSNSLLYKTNRFQVAVRLFSNRSQKWEETLDYVSCFSLHSFRALAASCVLYNRKEHSQGLSIFDEYSFPSLELIQTSRVENVCARCCCRCFFSNLVLKFQNIYKITREKKFGFTLQLLQRNTSLDQLKETFIFLGNTIIKYFSNTKRPASTPNLLRENKPNTRSQIRVKKIPWP